MGKRARSRSMFTVEEARRRWPDLFVTAPAQPEEARGRKWSAAMPTNCARGHRHPSKLEARVCAEAHAIGAAEGLEVLLQVRFPLLNLSTDDLGRVLYFTPDFTLVRFGKVVRVVEAKSRRVSRDWARGKRAFEACYGVKVEERDGR